MKIARIKFNNGKNTIDYEMDFLNTDNFISKNQSTGNQTDVSPNQRCVNLIF